MHDKHNRTYTVKCAAGLYVASGIATDYAKGELKIPYAYTLEMRTGPIDGFILPPEQIIPTGEEIMAFHVVVAKQIVGEFSS